MFDKLLEELEGLETLQKALPADDAADDEKIAAAAEEGNPDADGDDKNDVNGDDAADAGDDAGGEEEQMGKSFSFKLEDGTEVDAVDGTELVKSLMARLDNTEGQMAKALGSAVNLIKSQGEMIKSLQAKVTALGDSGRGRKTVVSVTEKPTVGADLAKSHQDGMTGQEFLAKSHAAYDAKKISGVELTTIDVSLRGGTAIDPSLIQKVLS